MLLLSRKVTSVDKLKRWNEVWVTMVWVKLTECVFNCFFLFFLSLVYSETHIKLSLNNSSCWKITAVTAFCLVRGWMNPNSGIILSKGRFRDNENKLRLFSLNFFFSNAKKNKKKQQQQQKKPPNDWLKNWSFTDERVEENCNHKLSNLVIEQILPSWSSLRYIGQCKVNRAWFRYRDYSDGGICNLKHFI